MDKNTNYQPLIQPYSYTTPHNIHSSAIYNQYTPSPSSITPQLAYSKTRTGCISRCPCTCVTMPRNFPTPASREARAVNKRAKESSSDESNKENEELSTNSTSRPKKTKRMYTRRRTVDEKLSEVFSAIKSVDWSFADFEYYAFWHQDDHGKPVQWTHQHAVTIQKFLAGNMKYSPADIINSWIHMKDGCLDRDSELMFSITTPFTEIKSVWPCLTSFAAQIIKRRLVKEAAQAVHSLSGLHALIARTTSMYIDRNPVFPIPVASIANRSTPSSILQIPSI
jgi:hypothetical protein